MNGVRVIQRVVQSVNLTYGTEYKAFVRLSKGQIWHFLMENNEGTWYMLNRKNVTICIPKADFESVFAEVE